MMTEANKILELISAEEILQKNPYITLYISAKIYEGDATSNFQRHLRRPSTEIGGRKNCRMKKRWGRNDGILTLS